MKSSWTESYTPDDGKDWQEIGRRSARLWLQAGHKVTVKSSKAAMNLRITMNPTCGSLTTVHDKTGKCIGLGRRTGQPAARFA